MAIQNLFSLPDGAGRRKMAGEELTAFFEHIHGHVPLELITFVCIGTDRSTGDALGPLVGSRLRSYGFMNVIGTLEQPCDANNLKQQLETIPDDHTVIAVDACLGQPGTVGSFIVSNNPLIPAQSVGTDLPAVGNYSIAAVVNVYGPKPYWTLQMTSLYQVMQMADQIAEAAAKAFALIQVS
ncbi:spore protease YyaC [Paenibacillus sediminis]|uniref:Sporulation protein YyaC n=1 Tax=Paenibacillus sediminis TaxID=664909 RepID=A0ABS4H3L2_9BACL|nr:spore protease YyaC [Paenibacillus sediminis]MBP1937119.1 putative sporulation protein YyaC [Paenibacillus sediminis]